MATKLPPVFWSEIRRHWEYDPDAPSYEAAARRAAETLDFKPPVRSAVFNRAHVEKWERRGNMAGVNVAAHLKADLLLNDANTGGPEKKAQARAHAAQRSNAEAVDVRAEVVARHREEWELVGVLLDEALAIRAADATESFNRTKLAKITAETIALRQAGERKAWNLDIPDIADLSKYTDEQLEIIASGRRLPGMA